MRRHTLARPWLSLPEFVPLFASIGSTVIRKAEKIVQIFRRQRGSYFNVSNTRGTYETVFRLVSRFICELRLRIHPEG
jgi:hypothetical protein